MSDNRNMIVVGLVVILLIGIAGVFIFGSRQGSQEELTATVASEVKSNEVVVTEEVTQATSAVENTPETAEVAVEESILPTPRTSLESTDPAVVSLASGEIQLVEFFAFW